jgi:pimeloyl-ACP methyl ester carboxylesterase
MSGGERRRDAVGGGAIAYEVAGSGSPLVLVHGLSASARWWSRNVPGLARHFRVYAIDLIGFGGSAARGRFVLAEAARRLAAWMAETGVGPAAVVGHSMGGLVAAELAADAPELVDRLVLTAAVGLPFGHGYPRQLLGMARAFARLPPSLLPVFLGDTLRSGLVTNWQAAHELLAIDASEMLGRVRSPALVVWGGRDTVVPLRVGERLVEALADARLAVIPRAGHAPMWERPAEFNRLLVEFLAEGDTQTSGHESHE